MEWLQNPATQSSVVPFFISLISALILYRLQRYYSALCVVFGFFAALVVTPGAIGTSWTSTSRLLIWVLLTLLVTIVVEVLGSGSRTKGITAVVLAMLGVVFVFWTILVQQTRSGMLLWLILGWLYLWVMVLSVNRGQHKPIALYVASMVFALATGAMALLNGSALVMQLNFSWAAATGAFLAVIMFWPGEPGKLLVYAIPTTAITLSAMLGFNMQILESAWILLPLAAIIIPVCFFAPERGSKWRQAFVALALTLPGVTASGLYMWLTADFSSSY